MSQSTSRLAGRHGPEEIAALPGALIPLEGSLQSGVSFR
jgi:hypothetical protein